MRPIRIHAFSKREDNVVREPFDLSWAELVEFFSTHNVSENKNSSAVVAGTFVSASDIFKPATRNIYEADGQTLKEEKLLTDELGRKQVGRYAQNLLSVEGLMLDYDGGAKLEDIIERFQDITHLGYTSYNHLVTPGVDKFRVFIPFTTPCPADEFVGRKKAFLEFASGCDASTLTKARVIGVETLGDGHLSFPSRTERRTSPASHRA